MKTNYNVLILIIIFLTSCSVPLKQTQLLEPQMNKQDVKQILKTPYLTSYKNGFQIWDYHLQYALNNTYPYRLIFDKDGKLVWWGFNNEESERILKALETLKGTEVFPFNVKVEVEEKNK